MERSDRSGWKLAGVIAAMALGAALLTWWAREPLPPDELGSPSMLGMPLIVDGAPLRIVLLTEQPGRRHFWGYANGMRWGKPASEPFRRIDVMALDENLGVLWRQRLRDDDQAFHLTDFRLHGLSADGTRVVVALDRPVVVSLRDGTTTEAVATDVAAAPWATFDTRRLLARGVRVGGRWIGVLTDAEIAKLSSADGRAQGWHPEALGPAGADASLYGLWTASVGADDRADVDTLRRLAPGDDFAPAGLLVDPDGEPIGATADHVFVLARDADAGWSLVHVAVDGTGLRRTPLPLTELALVAAGDDALVFHGHAAPAGTEMSALPRHGVLASLRIADGRLIVLPVADLRTD